MCSLFKNMKCVTEKVLVIHKIKIVFLLSATDFKQIVNVLCNKMH